MTGAEDVSAMAARVELLNELYKRDGRENPDHEWHGFYTGLFARYVADESNG